jgi:CheY-like chemotaxis protein
LRVLIHNPHVEALKSMPQEELAGRVLLAEVRRALHHLYDPIELRKSPLIALFGLDSHGTLRQVLEQGVAALKPAAGVSQQSDAWRTYRVLHHRYIEQFDQNDVAGNLNLSIRQLRRQEGVALQSIADMLCERFGLKCVADPVDDESGSAAGDSATTAENELALAERTYPNRPTDLAPILDAVRDTIKPMADALGVVLLFDMLAPDAAAIRVNVSQQPLRQALLTALPGLLQRSQGGVVRIHVTSTQSHARIALSAETKPPSAGSLPDDAARFQEDLSMVRRLLVMCNGELTMDNAGHSLTMLVPNAETVPVLVVDDNADAHALFARFLANSRYHLIGAQSAAQAESVLRDTLPRVVVLDVMLPEVDGWEMLGRLRENPQTRGIPVIVCTILPQEKLALTLSAAAFLRKPVKQAELLATLDQLTGA